MEKHGNMQDMKNGYAWNQKGRRTAMACRVLSFLIMPLLWLLLTCVVIIGQVREPAMTFTGLVLIFLSILVVLIGVLVFLENLFAGISRKMKPEERHDFILYRYFHVYQRSERLRNEALLILAQMDLVTGENERAETELHAVSTEKLNGRMLKIYDLLRIVTEAEKDNGSEEAGEWYIRYAGLSDETDEFPANEVVKDWIDEKVNPEEMKEVIAAVSVSGHGRALAPLIFCILAGHCIFFTAVLYFRQSGWELRCGYENAAGLITVLCLLVLGVWILAIMIRVRKKRSGSKVRLVIASVCWVLIVMILSGWTLLKTALDSDRKETILQRDVVADGRTYTYLKTETEGYGEKEYYRTADFLFMEKWEEAAIYDHENKALSVTEDSSVNTPSPLPADTGDPDTASDDGFTAQNAMQRVYEYLKDSGVYENLSISYNANAKGDLYALILKEADDELRLYDNGEKDAGREIVLEKVYPGGSRDNELIDFYLVDGKGNVTDEHKTDW